LKENVTFREKHPVVASRNSAILMRIAKGTRRSQIATRVIVSGRLLLPWLIEKDFFRGKSMMCTLTAP
jgi:hypothetical protein